MLYNKAKENIIMNTTEEAIISTAMLSTFYDQSNKDLLDLLSPFVEYAIAEIYNVGEILSDFNRITQYLCQNFGFEVFPINVVQKVFVRLSKTVLEKKGKNYILKMSLGERKNQIDISRVAARQSYDEILQSMKNYISKNNSTYNLDRLSDDFILYLNKVGISLMRNEKNFTIYSSKTEKAFYLISEFVLSVQKEPEQFKKLINIIKGLLLTKAISYIDDNNNMFKAKFSSMNVYLDTSIILCVLGLKTEGENNAIKEMLQLLPSNVKLKCNVHIYDEVYGIIKAYSYIKNRSHLTLEYFDKNNYSQEDVERYLLCLQAKIITRNVDIVNDDKYQFEYNNLSYNVQNDDGEFFLETLKINGKVYSDKNAINDIKSIELIKKERANCRISTIESCKAIFITNNNYLVSTSRKFYKDKISNAMSEIDFTTLLWLKSDFMKNDFPTKFITAAAMTSIESVPESFTKSFLEKIDKYTKEGDFTVVEANLCKEQSFLKKELAIITKNDFDEVTKEDVRSVIDDFTKSINKKDMNIIEKQKDVISEYERILEKKNTDDECRKLKQLQFIKNKSERFGEIISNIVLVFIYGAIAACIVASSAYMIVVEIRDSNNTGSIIFLVISILLVISSICDLFCKPMKYLNKLKCIIKEKASEYKREKLIKNNIY